MPGAQIQHDGKPFTQEDHHDLQPKRWHRLHNDAVNLVIALNNESSVVIVDAIYNLVMLPYS
jgi:hypothetical protein